MEVPPPGKAIGAAAAGPGLVCRNTRPKLVWRWCWEESLCAMHGQAWRVRDVIDLGIWNLWRMPEIDTDEDLGRLAEMSMQMPL